MIHWLKLRRQTLLWLCLLAPLSVLAGSGTSLARDVQTSEPVRIQANVAGVRLDVYTYRPANCASPSILMVFHGNGRGAKSYAKSARTIADRACFVIYAPLFDKKRFPNWAYHRGGVFRKGALLPEDKWTTRIVGDLVSWARQQEGRPAVDCFLFGHSAGGQFLSRVAAYSLPANVNRIILANPSTYVLPTTDEAAPYGYGSLPKTRAENWMRSYLAAPVTIFIGSKDTGGKDLTKTKPALRQGKNRLKRAEQTFDAAKRAAVERGWTFNWKLVYADGIAHSGRGMLTADELIEALGF